MIQNDDVQFFILFSSRLPLRSPLGVFRASRGAKAGARPRLDDVDLSLGCDVASAEPQRCLVRELLRHDLALLLSGRDE